MRVAAQRLGPSHWLGPCCKLQIVVAARAVIALGIRSASNSISWYFSTAKVMLASVSAVYAAGASQDHAAFAVLAVARRIAGRRRAATLRSRLVGAELHMQRASKICVRRIFPTQKRSGSLCSDAEGSGNLCRSITRPHPRSELYHLPLASRCDEGSRGYPSLCA